MAVIPRMEGKVQLSRTFQSLALSNRLFWMLWAFHQIDPLRYAICRIILPFLPMNPPVTWQIMRSHLETVNWIPKTRRSINWPWRSWITRRRSTSSLMWSRRVCWLRPNRKNLQKQPFLSWMPSWDDFWRLQRKILTRYGRCKTSQRSRLKHRVRSR